jgi:hypothetical protein
VIRLSALLALARVWMNEIRRSRGLIRWPVFALLPLGFALLGVQAIELIKRIAFLRGPDSRSHARSRPRLWRRAAEMLQKEVAEREGSTGGQAMIQFIGANMAPIMFASLIVFLRLAIRSPSRSARAGCSSASSASSSGSCRRRCHAAAAHSASCRTTRFAVPFFTLMYRSSSDREWQRTCSTPSAVRPIRGGLAYAVILVGAMLAATTGVVAASVISMGLISLPSCCATATTGASRAA